MRAYLLRTALVGLIISGCGDGIKQVTLTHRGFPVVIKSAAANQRQMSKARSLIKSRLDALMDADGELARLNKDRRLENPAQDFVLFLKSIADLSASTGGAYSLFEDGISSPWHTRFGNKRHPVESVQNLSPPDTVSRIEFAPDGSVTISGDGRIDPGAACLGWAADGAAELMREAGVGDGLITIGAVGRSWGTPTPDNNWEWTFSVMDADTVSWSARFPDGGFGLGSIQEMRRFAAIAAQSYDAGAAPMSEPMEIIGVLVWAKDGVTAAALSEGLYHMGRRAALGWASDSDDFAWMLVFRDRLGSVAELDAKMAQWTRAL